MTHPLLLLAGIKAIATGVAVYRTVKKRRDRGDDASVIQVLKDTLSLKKKKDVPEDNPHRS